MRVTVTSRSTVGDHLRTYAEEKLDRLDRHARLHELRITLDSDPHHVPSGWAEIVAHLDHHRLVAKVEAPTLQAAIDLVVDKMDAQVRKRKDRLGEHKGSSGADGMSGTSPA